MSKLFLVFSIFLKDNALLYIFWSVNKSGENTLKLVKKNRGNSLKWLDVPKLLDPLK